ncbi:MAG: hypothetical protein Q9162_004394 [Coniocarpon cinnabarinum]
MFSQSFSSVSSLAVAACLTQAAFAVGDEPQPDSLSSTITAAPLFARDTADPTTLDTRRHEGRAKRAAQTSAANSSNNSNGNGNSNSNTNNSNSINSQAGFERTASATRTHTANTATRTRTNQPHSSSPSSSSHHTKLSGGAIAGIVIGILAFLALILILTVLYVLHMRRARASRGPRPEMVGKMPSWESKSPSQDLGEKMHGGLGSPHDGANPEDHALGERGASYGNVNQRVTRRVEDMVEDEMGESRRGGVGSGEEGGVENVGSIAAAAAQGREASRVEMDGREANARGTTGGQEGVVEMPATPVEESRSPLSTERGNERQRGPEELEAENERQVPGTGVGTATATGDLHL